jgi:hypothetical protein
MIQKSTHQPRLNSRQLPSVSVTRCCHRPSSDGPLTTNTSVSCQGEEIDKKSLGDFADIERRGWGEFSLIFSSTPNAGSQRLSELLKQPYDLYKGGWCDQYMSGLINQVSQANDDAMSQEVHLTFIIQLSPTSYHTKTLLVSSRVAPATSDPFSHHLIIHHTLFFISLRL